MTRLASGLPVGADLEYADELTLGRALRRSPRRLAHPRLRTLARPVTETVVMKFGGTSVADAERIKRAARRIVGQRESGKRVVAVLSARGKTTDELIAMAEEVSPDPDRREMDMLLSTGERISCALCAMAINDLGHRAISLTGSQAGIVTDTSHTKARILDVRADRISEALGEDLIVLVAGFQGVSTSRDVTTLGRGGSDTTAVALAAAIGAEVCEIYTDVAGVFSADPRIVPDARKLPQVSFEEMLEMAASGARRAAAALGRVRPDPRRAHPLPVQLRPRPRYLCPRRRRDDGTPADHRRHPLDRRGADHAASACRTARARRRRSSSRSPTPTATSTRSSRTSRWSDGRDAEVSFTIGTEDLRAAEQALEPVQAELGVTESIPTARSARSRSWAPGMRSHPGVAAKVFQTLATEGINIEMISTSPIKISCVIRADSVPQAVRALHAAFELGEGGIEPDQGPTMTTRGRGRRHRRRRADDARAAARARVPGRRDRAVRLGRGRPAAEIDGRPVAAARRQRRPERVRHRAVLRRGRHLARVGATSSWTHGATVIDNSSAFRRDPDVPLVVSEVNPARARAATAA